MKFSSPENHVAFDPFEKKWEVQATDNTKLKKEEVDDVLLLFYYKVK